MLPLTMRPGSGMRRRMDGAVIDLPLLDSPTMPTVSPLFTSKLTPSTALTTPLEVKKWVLRPSTWSRGASLLLPHPRIDGVPQPVPEPVEGEDGQRQGQ